LRLPTPWSSYLTVGTSQQGKLIVVAHADPARTRSGSSARASQPREREETMSRKPKAKPSTDEMRAEYDFSRGVRGKYYERYQKGTNLVLLEPDIAKAFPDSASVNKALRLLVDLAKREARHPK